jgi:outer membrane immunogenic protein
MRGDGLDRFGGAIVLSSGSEGGAMKMLLPAVMATGLGFLISYPAGAADFKPILKVPLPPAPTYNWTGFYVGAGLGYGMYNLDTQWFAAGLPFTMPLTQTMGGRGWLGTVTAGADYQFNDRIVAGVFADYDFADMKGTIENQGAFSVGDMTETGAWAIGGRLGWLVDPDILTYFSGGYTQARFSSESQPEAGNNV